MNIMIRFHYIQTYLHSTISTYCIVFVMYLVDPVSIYLEHRRVTLCSDVGSYLKLVGKQHCEGHNLPPLIKIGLTDLP